MHTRRSFLRSVAGLAATGTVLATFKNDALTRIRAATAGVAGTSADVTAGDEDFWLQIQQAFTLNRNVINLNNGGVSPSPRVVQDAMRRYLEFSNQTPSHNMWRVLEPQIEMVRTRLARHFGCDLEEIAITRNASEALETVILGLDLKRGDEVICTNQNYPRMQNTWKQRARRDGIVFKTFSVPTNPRDPAELLEAYKKHITRKTRVMEVCHVTNLNGQIYPVRDIVSLGKARGIEVIVDGAHAFAHFPFQLEDLQCDFYGTSLHKWLTAPHGTGFLYVRKNRIKDVWPLMAATRRQDEDIRKFEEIGTHPIANRAAIGEALTFYEGIGADRKAGRLRFLSRYWIRRLEKHARVKLLTNDDPTQSCGLRLLRIEGLDSGVLGSHLLKKHGIVTTTIKHMVETPMGKQAEFQGLRITPNVYTTLRELDLFVDAIETAMKNGI